MPAGKIKEVFILEHVPNEKAGTMLDFLKERKIPFREIPLYRKGSSFPDPGSARAVIAMGGPMNVYEEGAFPFLAEENDFIRRVVRAGIPYLGVCLGAQLLAKALGARVYKAKQPEVGWGDIHFSPAAKKDKLFGDLGSQGLRVLQWHEDTFDLPKNAVHLASSAIVPNQAYCVDKLFYGFQFHVEINRPMLEDWFKKRPDLDGILSEYDHYKEALGRITDQIYQSFSSLFPPFIKEFKD